MFRDIIKFGWSEEYAVDETFDLNCLRELIKVKELGRGYALDAEKSGIVVHIGKGSLVAIAEEAAENLKIRDLEDNLDSYRRAYEESQKTVKQLKEKLTNIQSVTEE
jgi:hypothetical protein